MVSLRNVPSELMTKYFLPVPPQFSVVRGTTPRHY